MVGRDFQADGTAFVECKAGRLGKVGVVRAHVDHGIIGLEHGVDGKLDQGHIDDSIKCQDTELGTRQWRFDSKFCNFKKEKVEKWTGIDSTDPQVVQTGLRKLLIP